MSPAFLRRAAVLLAALVVVWTGLALLRRGWGGEPDEFRLPVLDSSAVTSVTIARPSDTIQVTRTDTGWVVNGFRAAQNVVSFLLADLADTAARGELVAEARASHARLGLDSASARRLTVRGSSGVLLDVLVGNRGRVYQSMYLRRDADDRVYQVTTRLIEVVERSLDDWRDKRIVLFPADSFGTVEVQRGRTRFAVERYGTGWRIGADQADSSAVDSWIRRLTDATASSFPTQPEIDSAKFEPPERSVVIRGRAGQVLVSLSFDSTASGYLVRRKPDGTVFRLDTWTTSQIFVSDSTLRPRSQP
jgi:hypothetical protein